MTNNSIYSATVDSLIKQAWVDFRLEECLRYIAGNTYVIDPDESGSDVLVLARYINEIHLPVYVESSNANNYKAILGNAIGKMMTGNIDKVIFRQCYNPYTFKVSCPSFTVFLPLILTRAFMSLLRIYGIKCEAEKRNRSLCNELNIFLTELAFTGKSDINMPVFKPVMEACKAIKGKINPWFKEEEEQVDNEVQYSEANLRFRGAEWFEKAQNDVTLIGCGGLGSNIAVSLCRVLGDKYLTVYDPDIVEHKNLAGQNFGISDIGVKKSAIVKSQCLSFNPMMSIATNDRFSERSFLNDIVITGLDNMATRSLVFSKWQGKIVEDEDATNKDLLLIDARLSAEKWQVFCITGDNKAAQDEYEKNWLFSDEDADSDVCSYKQTAYAAQMCASFVTNLYINFCTNLGKEDNDPLRRYLPFMTEYDASQMILRYKDL